MTYAEAVGRLLALRGGEHAGMRPGLERVHALLDALGHPEERYTLVQVGGTNGKGSVAAMLATMLHVAGRRVGLYTSPHLVSFRERIRVDGVPIPEDAVADGVDALGTLIARVDATMFEAATVLALDHFAREGIDIAVLEVGLGGRLDATTVGCPAVAVLTRIDLDHQAILGPTLSDIAREKAAIIRTGQALSAAQEPAVAGVLDARAEEARVPLLCEGRELHVAVLGRDLAGQRIACAGPGWELTGLELALLGSFQPRNALLAVAAARALGVPEAAIRAGLAGVAWPGRFQVIGDGPWLVLDGAHNPAGAQALARSLEDVFGERPLTLVVGVLGDKDAAAMLATLAPLARRVIVTRASNPRAMSPAALQALLPPGGPAVAMADTVGEALRLATPGSPDAVTCVAGSLSLVGDALRHLGGEKPCPIEKAAASIRFRY